MFPVVIGFEMAVRKIQTAVLKALAKIERIHTGFFQDGKEFIGVLVIIKPNTVGKLRNTLKRVLLALNWNQNAICSRQRIDS